MSFNSPVVSSARAARIVACLLTVIAFGCARRTMYNYDNEPRSFPGVQMTRVPSGGVSIRIRGGLVGSGQPIYIVNDVRVTVDSIRGIDWLQPEDILRITVLKDPAETTVYGESGMNGVVLITTKRKVHLR